MHDAPLNAVLKAIASAPFCGAALQWCRQASPAPLHIADAAGSLPAFILHHLWSATRRTMLCVLPDADRARYLHSDLAQIAGDTGHLLLFPPSGRTPYDQEQDTHIYTLVQRADVLQQLGEGFVGIIVTSVAALVERTPTRSSLRRASRTLKVGDTAAPHELVDSLMGQGFERVRFVEQPGDIAWRGGIVDIFSFSGDYPFRIEFFGDEIESLREFDPSSQRSVSNLEAVRIAPRLERFAATDTAYSSLFDFLADNTLIAHFDSLRHAALADERFSAAEDRFAALASPDTLAQPALRYLTGDTLQAAFEQRPQLHFGAFVDSSRASQCSAASRPQPAFNRQMKILRSHLADSAAQSVFTHILCDSSGQKDRLADLLESALARGHLKLSVQSLHEGFELPAARLAVYTDHQIFGRYHRPVTRKRKRHGGIRLHELRRLQPGDFVVHTDYGVGKFAGFRNITVRGKKQEAVRLHYAEGDVLYINVNALYKLHKYSGKEGHTPKLTKLGSGQWERSKRKTKKRIKDIARDLIKLYAQRKASKGHSFPADTIWQREMEASFAFEDTPDQFAATEVVKRDMEMTAPMDRLLCGDVGFGKTEVAVRAAFKAVQDGKQVAVLVPTTVLARQHQETFARRLEPFPVKVEVLTRHRTGKAVRDLLDQLKKGTVDILIGTHRIISKDVHFNDLGLLIVDEEQRFGVGVKERLRQLRVNVDTLTLTATPIPRTLQFSLMGARDLSIIDTAPPNRQSIETEIHSFDTGLIRDAILYEVSRGGQVFFVHNRVRSIGDIAGMLRDLVPGVRFQVAHGQMKAADMERVMTGFIDHKCDVLVSTTIIENGLDIPNVNTMIIHHAQRFGLAELHQLRGRVGRSDRKAFCYLLVPSIHALTREARQRLRAVEQLNELGSGFQIAMRDLDIRGAGNVLGGEQSGFIADLGYDTYQKVLDDAVRELRADEFPSLAVEAPAPAATDTTADAAAEASLPRHYVESDLERLGLYRRLSEAPSKEAILELRAEIKDRFGPLPREARNLFGVMLMRHYAQQLHLPRVVHRKQRLFLHLALDDPKFKEHCFQPLLERLSALGLRYFLRESKRGVPRVIVQEVPRLADAVAVLEKLNA